MLDNTSPRPWTYDIWTTGGGRVVCGVVFDSIHAYITSHNPNYADDAALIVRAVNAHEALVKALDEMYEAMVAYELDVGETPPYTHSEMMLRAAAALKLAHGGDTNE